VRPEPLSRDRPRVPGEPESDAGSMMVTPQHITEATTGEALILRHRFPIVCELRAPLATPESVDVDWARYERERSLVAYHHTGCGCGSPSVIAESPVEYYDGLSLDSDDRAADLRSVRA
jgi:hypothetical protein